LVGLLVRVARGMMDPLTLDSAEEGLEHGVVVAVDNERKTQAFSFGKLAFYH
jgi:hypothetical protein